MAQSAITCDGCGRTMKEGGWVMFTLLDHKTGAPEGDEVHLCPECAKGAVAAVGTAVGKTNRG